MIPAISKSFELPTFLVVMDLRTSVKLLFILVGCLLAYYYSMQVYLPWSSLYLKKYDFPTSSAEDNFTHRRIVVSESPLLHSVLVFLHIQKTAGSLIERALVKSGLIGRECKCREGQWRCLCKTSAGDTWLVSRFSTGWLCGLHADLTEYSECLDSALNVVDGRLTKRKYIFFTMLRDPVERYLSEWLQVRRGSTWHASRLRCDGRNISATFYRPCYTLPEYQSPQGMADVLQPIRSRHHPTWSLVPLTTFLKCPYNLANNRQTRMLAELPRLGCYRNLINWSFTPAQSDLSSRLVQLDLRASAKHALLSRIRVFGLSEYLIYSQYLYHRSLNVIFKNLLTGVKSVPLVTRNTTHAALIRAALNASMVRAVQDRNQLDLDLYRFARRLFIRRLTVYLLGDLTVPRTLRRPLFTLWSHQPCLWTALEYLLLNNTSLISFRRRLERQLIRGFLHQGSMPLADTDAKFKRNQWENKLIVDFRVAGLSAAAGLTDSTSEYLQQYRDKYEEEQSEM